MTSFDFTAADESDLLMSNPNHAARAPLPSYSDYGEDSEPGSSAEERDEEEEEEGGEDLTKGFERITRVVS